jgi:ParB family chromosome partitioning protein
MVGLDSIPAIVRRRDYDTATRLVRQLVENIQREDLNDVDRAAGLLRLKEVMQDEMAAMIAESAASTTAAAPASPWARTITWAKVGKRLGYTRQRIHQLIRLLDLPNEIKEDVRDGRLSERETRVYHGLRKRHQNSLHRARYRENLSQSEVRSVARHLKEEPSLSVTRAIVEVRNPPPVQTEQVLDPSFESESRPIPTPVVPSADREAARENEPERPVQALRSQPWTEGGVLPARQTRPTGIDRLDYIRGHLARIPRQGLTTAEQGEMVRLLTLIRQDVASLLDSLQTETEPEA